MKTRLVFMGTPDFAVPALKALMNSSAYEVVTVVTQPDRPKGRGKKLMPSPVKITALSAGLPVWQPPTLRTPEAVAHLTELAPEVIVVAAFGQILKQNVLDIPPKACINIHASLLPRWRGAAPVAAAIRAGDAETGVTIMLINEQLDAGDMLAKRAIPITDNHTRESLTVELAQLGADLLVDTLPSWLAGGITPEPQAEAGVTLAPRLQKTAGEIDWRLPAAEIARLVRAFHPWPSAYSFSPRGQFKVLEVSLAATTSSELPGTVFKHQRQVCVQTGDDVIQLITVQPAGKNPMSALAMLNGQPELWGKKLGPSSA